MCGIAGFAGSGERTDLKRMTSALAHRGPDGEGFHVDAEARVFLGHRRLAIIDLAGGAQPMWNETGSVCVVYNGEIYNHAELRAALIARGHRFQTDHSDTEVLVHGYEEWGDDLPRRLNGMFAFAIWDAERRRIFLARDRFGEKPLCYLHRPGTFAFASELSALAEHPACARTIDRKALQKYFAYGYVPAPLALYEGCAKLPGGAHLTYDLRSGAVAIAQYWRFRIEPDEALGARREEDLAAELRALIIQAVRRRLISDVPIGVFLSGGIDSGAVLAAAATAAGSAVKSFTVGFTEPSYDESPYARELATLYRTLHHEETLDLDRARDLVPEILGRLDEPLGDASIIPTYLLSRFTRQHVTVALSGDGGDELFAGYDPFSALAPAALYDRVVPRPLHRGLRRLADLLPISGRNMALDFKLRRSLMGLSYGEALWNPVWLAPLEPAAIAELLEERVSAEELFAEVLALWHDSGSGDIVDRTLEFYTNFYLQNDILTKVDRAAMMVSLESRAVFLDNDLVEFCRRLPHRFKYRNGERKYLLKKAVADMLPERLLRRPKKGFGIPLASWLKSVPAVPPLAPVEGVRMDWVRRRWAEHRSGARDHRLFLWSWLSLQSLLPGAGAASWRGAA